MNPRALEPFRRLGDNVARIQLDVGAKRFQRHEVKIDGRVPMAHPPGRDTFASPQRANSGASTQKLARIRATIS
ncbi:MAG: hypothetical protein A49_04790 [Methyloceanibacter sp.]|nr:MAG: hypothetical protein A49_04790 [Methyloceanibacter sp.]